MHWETLAQSVVAGIIIGIPSAYLGVKIALTRLEGRVDAHKDRLDAQRDELGDHDERLKWLERLGGRGTSTRR